jgi:uncharacterized protein (DUF1697 family)
MEQRWVALLRGINLASRNRVAMADVRRVFDEAGCRDVRTYINSGNVVFTKQAKDRVRLARTLERAVENELGVAAAVVLRTPAELRRILAAHPFGRDTSKTHVSFLAARPPAKAVAEVKKADVAPDRLEVRGTEVFLHLPNGRQGMRIKASLLAPLGVATDRSWRTVAKLAELAVTADADSPSQGRPKRGGKR